MLSEFQRSIHYPCDQTDENSKANEMITEFPGNFCGTLYSNVTKKVLEKSTTDTSLFSLNINHFEADYLLDAYLTVDIPDKFLPMIGDDPKEFISGLIEGVQIQRDNSVLQKLMIQNFDNKFDWSFRLVTSSTIAIKFPWFFSGKTRDALPIMFMKTDEEKELQFKILFTTKGVSEKYQKVKYTFITENASILDMEREYLLDTKNPNRFKRVIYEEKPLDECKESDYIVRISWNADDTVIGFNGNDVSSRKDVYVYPDFFGNEWIQKSGRFGYSLSVSPGRAVSSVLSGITRKDLRVKNQDEKEKIYVVIEKVSMFIKSLFQIVP